MLEYHIALYTKTTSHKEAAQFWELHYKYHGTGRSDTKKDKRILGMYFDVFIASEKELTLEGIKEEFPNLAIMDLEEISSR